MNSLPRDAQGNVNRKDAKRHIATAASDMEHYTKRVEAELPLFRDAMNTGMNALIRGLSMSVDLEAHKAQTEKEREGLDAIITLRNTLVNSNHNLTDFRATVIGMPRMTSELNRAKRGVVTALDKLISEFANGETLLSESEKVIRDILRHKNGV